MRSIGIIFGIAVIIAMIILGILFYQEIQLELDKKDFCESLEGEIIRVSWKGIQCVKGDTMYSIAKLEGGFRLVK